MNSTLRRSLFVSAWLVFGAIVRLQADSVSLPPGTTVANVDMATNAPAFILGYESQIFSSAGVSGYVEMYALTNWSPNPYGAAAFAFAYQVFSDASSTVAIAGFVVDGFSGFNTSVAYYGYNAGTKPVSVTRSADGDTVGFEFPADSPLLPGGHSYQMIVFTDAIDYTYAPAYVTGGASLGLHNLAPSGHAAAGTKVPDESATALLAGLGIVSAALFARRRAAVALNRRALTRA